MFNRLTAYLVCFAMIGLNILHGTAYASGLPDSSSLDETQLLKKYPNAKGE